VIRVRFLRVFHWSPEKFNNRVTLVHQPGPRLVPTACGQAAIGKGAAVEISKEEYYASRATE
jgi:hypothetical protein